VKEKAGSGSTGERKQERGEASAEERVKGLKIADSVICQLF